MGNIMHNIFESREFSRCHDLKYLSTYSTSNKNAYLVVEGRRYAMPFIKLLTRGWFPSAEDNLLFWKADMTILYVPMD